jgi:hypothetical protein
MLCGFLMCFSCAAQQKRASVTADEVLRVLGSKDDVALTAAFNKSQKLYADRVARAFQEYRLKRSSERELFVVLPQSAEEIRELYQLTILNPPSGHEDLVSLYEGYFKAVFSAAPTHPEAIPTLFAVAANYGAPLSEGESPWFCDLLHKLYASAPDAYLQALATHPRYRQQALACAVACAAETP